MLSPKAAVRSVFVVAALASAFSAAHAQKPVVFPGGVVNAASFVKKGLPTHAVAQGSIAGVFGENLASSTASADRLPLPYTLAGTSVRINGVPASPGALVLCLPRTNQSAGAGGGDWQCVFWWRQGVPHCGDDGGRGQRPGNDADRELGPRHLHLGRERVRAGSGFQPSLRRVPVAEFPRE